MTPNDREHPLKKLIMIVLWRTQQIGQTASLVMLALTLALTVNAYIEWRFSNTYIGVVLTLTALVVFILIAGFIWDRKLRMWHEQSVVTAERNPFNMHKMTAKEIVHVSMLWVPFFTTRGGEMAELAERWKAWCSDQMAKDPQLRASVDELMGRYFEPPGLTVHRSV